jgi:hypothetical protein
MVHAPSFACPFFEPQVQGPPLVMDLSWCHAADLNFKMVIKELTSSWNKSTILSCCPSDSIYLHRLVVAGSIYRHQINVRISIGLVSVGSPHRGHRSRRLC